MGNIRGFLDVARQEHGKRPVAERIQDWREFELPAPEAALQDQASRCMDCGIPFCHAGCPLGNVIPEFNDHIYKNYFGRALASLHSTNNFPEFTGRVCPAPCEASCTLNLEQHPVTIKDIERSIIDRAWAAGAVLPRPAAFRTGRTVAVIGSGPSGLAAAQQLARKGHAVTLFEKDDQLGGLLRYGIPDFKLEKHLIDRRVAQMKAEGVTFRTGVHAGVELTGPELRARFDAVVLCGGARKPRDLALPGRALRGVEFAMPFLEQANRRVAGERIPTGLELLATGKQVVVIGGGDTGSDCLGTCTRQGAALVHQLELMPRPPEQRAAGNPWPAWPLILRTSSSQEEGGARDWGVQTTAFLDDGDGRLRALKAVRVGPAPDFAPIPGSAFELPCQLALLAMGFVGSERAGLLDQLGVELDPRGNVRTSGFRTTVDGVFAAGDMARGQSLVVWAIAEGRKAAAAVHAYLKTAPARPYS
jgi:glutamate synthase (NADPH/NADH) small chain